MNFLSFCVFCSLFFCASLSSNGRNDFKMKKKTKLFLKQKSNRFPKVGERSANMQKIATSKYRTTSWQYTRRKLPLSCIRFVSNTFYNSFRSFVLSTISFFRLFFLGERPNEKVLKLIFLHSFSAFIALLWFIFPFRYNIVPFSSDKE